VEACYQSSSLAVKMARETGARLHIAHVSSAKELSLLESKPIEQKQITAEAVIAHLMFSTEDYDRLGTKVKCNPSLKTPADQQALRKALTNGLIDVVATDHAPHLLSEKEGGALRAMSGMPMIQFSLVSMLEMADQGVLTIERIPELMSHNPAKLFHIEKRGFIRPGYYADLVLFDPEWMNAEMDFSDMHKFSTGVLKTFVAGGLAYDRANPDYHGRFGRFIKA
jgi:dihydroorotase